MDLFSPWYGSTQKISTIAGVVNAPIAANANALLITNAGASIVFVRIKPQQSSTDASETDYPVLPGASQIIGKDSSWSSTVSIYSAALGSLVYVTLGRWGR